MTGGLRTQVSTNDNKGSVCKVNVPAVKFQTVWNAYPDGHPSQEKNAKGELLYPDQCAIKVSVALHAAGVEMKSFAGAYTLVGGKRAALRAEQLSAWLDKTFTLRGFKLSPPCRARGISNGNVFRLFHI